MFTSDMLLSGGLPDIRVGIGRGTDKGRVERSVMALDGRDIRIYDDPELLAGDLASGNIDAAVRGDMSSSTLLPILKKKLGLESLERVVFLEPAGGKLVILTPVGIDEGWTDEQRHALGRKSAGLARKIGMGARVAVMSGGRCEDRGRCRVVDESIDSALRVVDMLRDDGIDAYHSQILIEEAMEDADIVIAPEGITGNIIFRTMHFIGGAKALGAPVVNADKVFVDTSRAKEDYTDSIALAMRLARQ